jgi:hypothetical protein
VRQSALYRLTNVALSSIFDQVRTAPPKRSRLSHFGGLVPPAS